MSTSTMLDHFDNWARQCSIMTSINTQSPMQSWDVVPCSLPKSILLVRGDHCVGDWMITMCSGPNLRHLALWMVMTAVCWVPTYTCIHIHSPYCFPAFFALDLSVYWCPTIHTSKRSDAPTLHTMSSFSFLFFQGGEGGEVSCVL